MRKKKKKRLIITFSLIGFFILFFLGAVEFTSRPQFCSTCHYMKTFYRSWKTSSHNQVECSTCHYPPGIRGTLRAKIEGILQLGRYWTKLYLKSKPWAEIPDSACLRPGCHEKRLLQGEVKFGKIVFDHTIHLTDLQRGKRLRCTSCHSQIVQGEHITVTQSSCFICHFKKSEHYPRISACSHCHKKDDLISEKTSRYDHSMIFKKSLECDKCHSHTIIGDGAVPQENCYKCHWEKEKLNKYENTDLIHSTHIESHKIECSLCHLPIQHKIVKDIQTISNCQSCHADSHQATKILFTGKGGKGVGQTMPNVMLEKGITCKGCHIFHQKKGGKLIESDISVSKPQVCDSCHGKGFSAILQDWQTSTSKKLDQVRDIYTRALQEYSQSPKKNKEIQTLLDEAMFNMEVVEKGKSVHNMAYSQKLLSVASQKLLKSLRLLGSSYQPEKKLFPEEVIPTECSNCHAGIEEISTPVYGVTFSHRTHLLEKKISCSTCHSNAPEHGQLIVSQKNCNECHHQKITPECHNCHQLQKSFYGGGSIAEQRVPPDMMSEAGVVCTDCHLNPQNQIIRPSESKCLDCHEKDYVQLGRSWKNNVKNLIQKVEDSFSGIKKLQLQPVQKSQLSKMENIYNNIIKDGSTGIHNYMFIEETLSSMAQKLKNLEENKD